MPNDTHPGSQAAIPNLYQALQLQPLENDVQAIETAVRRCIAQARGLQSSDPQAAQRLARVVELSRRYLLDSDHKAVYDRKWQANFASQSAMPVAADTFAEYLPHGDPTAHFDLADFLEGSAELPASSSDEDFRQLMDLLTGTGGALEPTTPSPTTPAPTTPAAVAVELQPTQEPTPMAVVPTTPGSAMGSPAAGPLLTPAPAVGPLGKPGSRSLAAELRSKRDRKLLTMIAGVLVSLAALLALVFFLLREPSQPDIPAVAQNAPAAAERPNNGNPLNGGPPAQPQGSGLPRVAGWDDEPDETDNNDMNQGGNMDDVPQQDMLLNTPLDMGLTQGERPADEPPMEAMTMEPAPATTATEPMAGKEPMNSTEPVIELTDDERRGWSAALVKIREQLSQKEFAAAQQGLEEAAPLSKTPDQRQQLIRLKTLAGLAAEFQQALVAAVASLQGGDVITVGSTPASFVEGSPERLIVKVNGQSKTYNLVDLPAGLALTLSELRLELGSPHTAARQAAFAGLHPRSSDVALQRARALMQEAVDGGAVADDMLLVFDEDYLKTE